MNMAVCVLLVELDSIGSGNFSSTSFPFLWHPILANSSAHQLPSIPTCALTLQRVTFMLLLSSILKILPYCRAYLIGAPFLLTHFLSNPVPNYLQVLYTKFGVRFYHTSHIFLYLNNVVTENIHHTNA